MTLIAIYIAVSVPIVWVSRRSLLHPSSHGFSRFFAFEAILALIVLNLRYWFADPLGSQQLVSWALLMSSVVFGVWGLANLRRIGGFRPTPDASPTFDWENTERLVTTGIYRYVRHPMYSSLLFLAWGATLKHVAFYSIILCVVASIALAATAMAEEAENLARFGQEYRDYMKRTRRFIPFIL